MKYHITHRETQGEYQQEWSAYIEIKNICCATVYNNVSEKELKKQINKYIYKSYRRYLFRLPSKVSLTNYLLIILILILLFK